MEEERGIPSEKKREKGEQKQNDREMKVQRDRKRCRESEQRKEKVRNKESERECVCVREIDTQKGQANDKNPEETEKNSKDRKKEYKKMIRKVGKRKFYYCFYRSHFFRLICQTMERELRNNASWYQQIRW